MSLQQYLLSKGWHNLNVNRDDIAVLRPPDGNALYDIWIPLTREFSDYNESILKAVAKIGSLESRDETQVLNDLIAPPSDIIRFRIDNESTQAGLIPLKDGFNLLDSAKKALLSTASDIVSPALFHKRMAYKEAVQFIDSCYLGQTERGSYVAPIVCPFISTTADDKPIQLSLFSGEHLLENSITRAVTKRLMQAVAKVKTAAETGNIEEFGNDAENQVSINFLESLVEINEFTQNSTIELSATWAPSVKTPDGVQHTITISSEHIEPIKAIIETLKPQVPEEVGAYVGKISAIKAAPDLINRQGGTISFVFIGADERASTARVNLSEDDFKRAIEAFENGKNVMINGILKIQNRQKIIDITAFKPLD